jgi:N-acetylneuraminic acid mutarotase
MAYDPAADTLTELTTDPWTGNAAGDTLPGGGAVYNNRLYVFGGFQINTGMVNTIYEFDPNGTAGSRWTLKTAMLPMALGYIPATTIGNYIYTAGGSEWDGTTITDSDFSYRYDPVADAVTTITSIPRLTAETRALTVNGTMWVLGGGRDAPNPSNEVNIFNPATNAWSTGPSFATARRNFPADIDPATGKIYIAGGYAPSSATNSMEIFTPAVLCATETPTAVPPTDTPTPLPPTATATPGSPQFRLYLPVALYNAGGARP